MEANKMHYFSTSSW